MRGWGLCRGRLLLLLLLVVVVVVAAPALSAAAATRASAPGACCPGAQPLPRPPPARPPWRSVWGTLEEQVAADLAAYSYQELAAALAQRGQRRRGRKEDLVAQLTALVVQVGCWRWW